MMRIATPRLNTFIICKQFASNTVYDNPECFLAFHER